MDEEIQKLIKLIKDYNTRNHLWVSSISASLVRISYQDSSTGEVTVTPILTVDEVSLRGGWLEIKPPSPNLLPNVFQEYVTPRCGWALKNLRAEDNTIVVHTFDGETITIKTLV